MKTKVRIAVVEGCAEFRGVLVHLLKSRPGWCLVSECASATQALQEIPSSKPDLVVMDFLLPGTSGMDLIRGLKRALPRVTIVMLTVVDSPSEIVGALEAGACGYLLKGGSARDLLFSLEEALTGGATMSPAVARRLISWFQQRQNVPKPEGFRLTDREWAVLRLASRGKQQGEISMILAIAVNTVKNHFRNIYEKLDVHSLADALIKLNQGRDLLDRR